MCRAFRTAATEIPIKLFGQLVPADRCNSELPCQRCDSDMSEVYRLKLNWRAFQPRARECTAVRAASTSAGELTRLDANRT